LKEKTNVCSNGEEPSTEATQTINAPTTVWGICIIFAASNQRFQKKEKKKKKGRAELHQVTSSNNAS